MHAYEESMKRLISYKIQVSTGEEEERILAWVLVGLLCGRGAGATVPMMGRSSWG